MDQWSDSKAIFQYAPVQTMLLLALTNINGLLLVTTEYTWQTKVYQSNIAISKHTIFGQLYAWATYTEVSFHSFYKKTQN